MKKIFYMDGLNSSTNDILKRILSEYFDINNVTILRTKNGKPFIKNGPHFSITHTNKRLYIVVSDKEIGLDCENLSRVPHFESIIKKFPITEQQEITSPETFLTHWVVKESAIKYLGGSIAHDLNKLCYFHQKLIYQGDPFPAKITLLKHENHILSVCGNEDFQITEFIKLT